MKIFQILASNLRPADYEGITEGGGYPVKTLHHCSLAALGKFEANFEKLYRNLLKFWEYFYKIFATFKEISRKF